MSVSRSRHTAGQAGYTEQLGRLHAYLTTGISAIDLRLCLYVAALLCLRLYVTFTHNHFADTHARLATLGRTMLLAGALALFYVACRSTIPHLLRPLLPHIRVLLAGAMVVTVLLAGYGVEYITHQITQLAQPNHYTSDAVAMSDCGTRLLLRGQNPYTTFNLVDCLTRFDMNGTETTPLQVGPFARARLYPTSGQLTQVFNQVRWQHEQWPPAFEGYFSYPAGTFLLPAPFLAVGVPSVDIVYVLCFLLACAMLIWLAPTSLRPWILLFGVGNTAAWAYLVGVEADWPEIVFLVAAWALWRRSLLSAVLMGIALGTRQNSWFFLPFYLIFVERMCGWRDLIRRGAVMAAVFALLNGAFFLQNPTKWIAGVMGTLRDPMFGGGDGLIGLAMQGWLPLWPRQVYTALEFAALIAGAAYYARVCRAQPATGLVLAVIPLFVSWRSAPIYYIPLTLLCLWPLIEATRAAGTAQANEYTQYDRPESARATAHGS